MISFYETQYIPNNTTRKEKVKSIPMFNLCIETIFYFGPSILHARFIKYEPYMGQSKWI